MNDAPREFLNIKHWAEEDRPREKLILKGRSYLSDAELIAILLGSGTASLSALDVAKNVLHVAGNDLNRLGTLTVKELEQVRGIGTAKAVTIVSALELGRRRKEVDQAQQLSVSNSSDAHRLIRGHLEDIPHEEFWIILLNRANRVLKKQRISLGGVAGTVADPKIIFKTAITELASGIILAHNHPSGSLQASSADLELTKKLKESGNLLEIQVLDHLIIAGKKYFSFADEGLM